MSKQRKPTHPGIILDEHYIKPLNISLQELADQLGISRNTLFKIRMGRTRVTTEIAIKFSMAFNTTPDLWLNLQKKYDLWQILNETHIKKIPRIYQAKQQPVLLSASKSYTKKNKKKVSN